MIRTYRQDMQQAQSRIAAIPSTTLATRFGYFGSTLPKNASPADQADAYVLLLDRLGVDRAVVMGASAGTASVLELARRHPNRVLGLILASARLGGGITTANCSNRSSGPLTAHNHCSGSSRSSRRQVTRE